RERGLRRQRGHLALARAARRGGGAGRYRCTPGGDARGSLPARRSPHDGRRAAARARPHRPRRAARPAGPLVPAGAAPRRPRARAVTRAPHRGALPGGPVERPASRESTQLFERARGLIPAATQTLAKGPRQHVLGVAPKFLARGKGARVWDVDGNSYLDFTMAIGPIILGYGWE